MKVKENNELKLIFSIILNWFWTTFPKITF